MKRAILTLMLFALAVPLSGCIVVDHHGGNWCYYHPYRCR
jgi:hypothetical protein